MKGRGYFISPRGDLIEVDTTHIDMIINYPEKFGLTKNYIEGMYKKYNEQPGQEGEAREEILKEIVKGGWLRIREYTNQFWSIQAYNLNKKIEKLLYRLSVLAKDKKISRYVSLFDEVRILDLSNDRMYYTTFNEILSGSFYKALFERLCLRDKNIVILEKIKIEDYVEEVILKLSEKQKEYFNIKNSNKIRVVNEKSLSRLYNKMQENNTGTITGYRSEYSKNENQQQNRSLQAKLQSLGYGITSVKGSYIENYGTSDAKEVGEHVSFVEDMKNSGRLKNDLIELGEEVDQDSILYIPQNTFKGYLIGTSKRDNSFSGYGKKLELNNAIFGKQGEFFTKVRNRPFVFESISKEIENPTGYFAKFACNTMAKKNWKDIEI